MFRHHEKSKPKKVVVDIRFDYIKNCQHDYGNQANCPLCKLVVQSTKKYFEDEAESNRLSRQKSLLNRAQMRINLLTNWSRCQNSFYSDYNSTQKLDIYISKSLADMIVKQNEHASVLDFTEIIKILGRKNRIKEVGHFACIYLQCRIRKFLAKQFIRLIMLKRFELIPATRTKSAFYVDNFKSHKWTRVPVLLRDEPPGSPRTMDRRIAAETKKKDMRMKRFQVALNKCNTDDIFAKEFHSVKLLKQFVIFRDLVALAMFRLAKNNSFGGVNSSLASASNMKSSTNSSFVAPSLINTNITFNGSFLLDTGPQYAAVWVCMSAPASTARQLGLSMALAVLSPIAARNNVKDQPIGSPSMDTPTPPVSTSSPATPSSGRKQLAPPNVSSPKVVDKKDTKRVSSVVPVNYNKALQVLESRAWDCLKCSTPEEVVAKLMFADILPSVESVLHISQDEHCIWHGGLDFVKQDNAHPAGQSRNIPTQVPSTTDDTFPPTSQVKTDPTLYQYEVLPMCMQLRPWYADRTANGYFRMFFYEEEFIACSQVSPWAFYPEVLKCRDPIIAALKNFAALSSTKMLVKSYHQQAVNMYQKTQTTSQAAATSATNVRKGSVTQVSTLTRRGSVTSTRDNNIAVAAANAAKSAGSNRKGNNRGAVVNMLTDMSSKSELPQIAVTASSSLFAPPQELIFETAQSKPDSVLSKVNPKGTAAKVSNSTNNSVVSVQTDSENSYSFDHPLDAAGLTDLKAIELSQKYSFLSKLHIFSDRLKKALNNTRKKTTAVAGSVNRKESNASTIASSGGTTVDTANSMDSLPYLADIHQAHSRTNEAQVRDMYAVQGDLIGHEVFHLLLGETIEEANSAMEAGNNLHEMGSIAEKSEKSGGRSTTGKRRESKDHSHAGSNNSQYDGETSEDDDNASLMSGTSQQTTTALPTLSRYAHKLNAYSSLIQTDVNSRIAIPPSVSSGIKSSPYQLMVIDVYVGLPKPNAAAAIAAGGMGPLSRQQGKNQGPSSPGLKSYGPGTPKYGNFTSASGSNDGNSTPSTARGNDMVSSRSNDRNDQTGSAASGLGLGGRRPAQMSTGSAMNLSDFLVDIHQIVGLFACSNERSPPNLDCGLLNWEYFTQIYRERTHTTPHKLGVPVPASSLASSASLQNASTASIASGGNTKERMWSPVNATTGVSVHKTLLPTGREFQFHMLAAAPSREHLDKELPKKVKIYLGMPVVTTK